MRAQIPVDRRARASRRLLRGALAALALALSLSAGQAAEPVAVITGTASTAPDSLVRSHAADIFLGRIPPGEVWHPIDTNDDGLRESFYRQVAGISANRAQAQWARLVFAARLSPPRVLSRDEAIAALQADPAAITYVYASQVPRNVRVLVVLSTEKNSP